MRVHAAVYCQNLAADEVAFIGTEIDTGVADVFGTAVAVDHDIAQEDILHNLYNVRIVLRGDDQTGTYAVAADIILAVWFLMRTQQNFGRPLCCIFKGENAAFQKMAAGVS